MMRDMYFLFLLLAVFGADWNVYEVVALTVMLKRTKRSLAFGHWRQCSQPAASTVFGGQVPSMVFDLQCP